VLQGNEPVLGLHGPDPSCATGRSVQRSLIALDRTLADAVAVSLREFTVRDVLQGLPGLPESLPVGGP